MHHHAGRFVEGKQIVVFVEHVEVERLGRHHTGTQACGQHDGHDVSQRGAQGHPANGRAVHGDTPLLDPALHARTRRLVDAGQVPAEHQVETPAGITAVRCQSPWKRHILTIIGEVIGELASWFSR